MAKVTKTMCDCKGCTREAVPIIASKVFTVEEGQVVRGETRKDVCAVHAQKLADRHEAIKEETKKKIAEIAKQEEERINRLYENLF
jgi:hypothetical protein